MDNSVRLNKILRELNITTSYAADVLANKGHLIDPKPTTKLTEQQVALLRKECQEEGIRYHEITDFELGHHYEFEIKENRDNFTIVNSKGYPADTFTSQRIYQQPGDKVKLYVKKFKDNGEPVLTYSVLNSYELNKNYLFDVTMSPRQNGYILENNEYHEHFVPLIFQSLIEDGTIKLKVSGLDEENNKLIFEDSELKHSQRHSSNDELDLINGQDYKFDVIGFEEDYNGEENLVKLRYKGKEYTTKALGFQKEYGLPKWIFCTVNKDQNLRLYQNIVKSYREEFEVQEPYTFIVVDEKVDQNDAPYYIVKDKVGFVHRFYKNQIPIETIPSKGVSIELFVAEINEKGKHLRLDWYQKDIYLQREFYSPEKIFDTIEGYSVEKNLYNLQEYIDIELDRIDDEEFKPPYLELFSQIEKENNNWFFSYLSLLLHYNNDLIRQHKYEQAKQFIQLYIDLEEWLIDSEFISAYSQSKKQDIIDHAESSADAQEDLLTLISDLENQRHYKKLDKIYSKLQKHGIISKRDLQKTIQFLNWDRTLLTAHYDLMYGIIHLLLDLNKIENNDLFFLNQITGQAYESTFASRNFVLTSGIQKINELEKDELTIENKHLFVQIRLNDAMKMHHFAIMKSAELLRNLALISSDSSQKKKFLLLSIDVIIKEISLSTLSANDFVNTLQLSIKLEKFLNAEVSGVNKLFYFKNSGVIVNSESGWLISNQLNSFDKNLETSDSLSVLLSLFDDRIKVITNSKLRERYSSLETSSTTFWGTYINNRKTLNDNFESLTANVLSERLHYIRSVIKSIDYIISIEGDINKKIEALQTAKLITVILRDNKSFYYHEMLRLYYRINGLEYNINNEDFAQPVNNETLEKFPVLEKIQTIHSLINEIGNKDNTLLYSFLESEFGNIRSIAKMIIAYNNVISEFPDKIDINKQLMSLIEASILNKALFIDSPSVNVENEFSEKRGYLGNKEYQVNNGREDIVTEFKTSIVYHPGSNEPEIDKQAGQIVKVITGFLNARGGKLYIGVKDNGLLVGLESDYKQLEINSDGYERIIRKYIVRLTNTTVNGLLEFEFANQDAIEYLIIHIPISGNLVDFKGDFYQRQGTETRLIKGQDLTSLFQKKLAGEVNLLNEEIPIRDQVELDFLTEESTVYESNKIIPEGSLTVLKEGLYKIGIYEDRSWVWSDTNKNFDFGASLNFTIADKNSYILICYSEGRLAKFRSRSFLSRNKNERQRNTFALRPDSEIVNIFEISNDIDFLVRTAFAGDTYLKIINSSESGDVRNRLASQGTYFIDSNNDGVLSIQPIDLKSLDSNQYSKLQMSKQTRGIISSSDKITDLVNELKIKKYV